MNNKNPTPFIWRHVESTKKESRIVTTHPGKDEHTLALVEDS